MAWLITLALFLWIGGGVCKLADRARDKQFRLQDDFDQKLTAIKANIYLLAWQECLNLQIDVLHTTNLGRRQSPAATYDATHDVNIQQQSVDHAINDLRSRGQNVFRLSEKGPMIVTPTDVFAVGIDAPKIKNDLPPVLGKFDILLGCEATDAKARQIAIPILNHEQPNSNILTWP